MLLPAFHHLNRVRIQVPAAPRTLPRRSGRLPAKFVDDFADRRFFSSIQQQRDEKILEQEMALTLQNKTAAFFSKYVSNNQIMKKTCCGGAW
jgi:hypothetical protein